MVTKNDLLVNSKISFNPSSETLNTNNITANKIVLNTVDGDDTSGVVHGNLNGNIITAEQSNITKLGTLSELNVNGTTTLTGELSVSNSIHLPNNSTNTDISTRITSTTKGTKLESVNSEIEIISDKLTFSSTNVIDSSQIHVTESIDSTDSSTGSIIVDGGIGIGGDINVSGSKLLVLI